MLFALAETRPYEWWGIKSLSAWALRNRLFYENSPERYFHQWLGEMTMFAYEGGFSAYRRYKEIMRNNESEQMLKGQAFGL